MGGFSAAVGIMIVMLLAAPGTAYAQIQPVVDDVANHMDALQNASVEDYVQEAEAQKNETLWTASDLILDAYGAVIAYWPKSTPLPRVEHDLLPGVEVAPRPIPAPPNPESMMQTRPEPTEKPPAPPSEEEMRHTIEAVAGSRSSTTGPEANGTEPSEAASDKATNSSTPMQSGDLPHVDTEGDSDPGRPPVGESPSATLTTVVSEANRVPAAEVAFFAAAGLALAAAAAWLISQARWLGRLLAGGPFAALFSRQTGTTVLQHQARARIHAAITQNPGATSVTLAQATGFPSSVLRYHLSILHREQLVRVTRRGRIYHYHDARTPVDEQARARECLFWSGRNWLATVILKHPGVSQQDVANMVGLPASRVCEYTKDLAAAGLVRSERVGRCRRYFPTRMLAGLDASGHLPTP